MADTTTAPVRTNQERKVKTSTLQKSQVQIPELDQVRSLRPATFSILEEGGDRKGRALSPVVEAVGYAPLAKKRHCAVLYSFFAARLP
jgi:hypothetical protein